MADLGLVRRVGVGGVDEGDPGVERGVDGPDGLCLVGSPGDGERHAAQADREDVDLGQAARGGAGGGAHRDGLPGRAPGSHSRVPPDVENQSHSLVRSPGCSTPSSSSSSSAACSRWPRSRSRRGSSGTWIVLRGLAFYAHAVGTAAFPGLVLADGLGFSAPLGRRRDGARRRRLGRLAGPARPRALRQRHRARPRRRRWPPACCWPATCSTRARTSRRCCSAACCVIAPGDVCVRGRRRAPWSWPPPRSLGRRWLATGFDPAAARALGVRSALPDAALLVAGRARGRRRAVGGGRAARHRAARRAGRDDAARLLDACGRGSPRPSRSPRSRASPACGCPSRPTRRPGRRSRCWLGGVFALVAAARVLRARRRTRPPRSRRGRRRARARGVRLRRRRVRVRRRPRRRRGHDDPARRLRARGRRRRRRRDPDPQAELRPARVRAAAEATSRRTAAAAVVLENGDGARRAGWARSSSRAAATRPSSTSAPRRPCGSPARPAARRRRGSTRTGGTTRVNAEAAVERIRARPDGGPARRPARRSRATPPPTSRGCARLDGGIRRVRRARSPPPGASSSPTTTPSATSPTATGSASSAP